MKIFLRIIVAVILGGSCGQNQSTTGKVQHIDSNAVYIPLRDLIQEEISKVDSFAAGIQLHTRKDTLRNNRYIKLDSFHIFAASFLAPLPNRETLQQNFTETNLYDETTGNLSLIYTPIDDANTLRTIVVYIEKGDFNDKVKRIYYEQVSSHKIRKNTWKMGQFFMLSEELSTSPDVSSIEQHQLIWDTSLFNEE